MDREEAFEFLDRTARGIADSIGLARSSPTRVLTGLELAALDGEAAAPMKETLAG